MKARIQRQRDARLKLTLVRIMAEGGITGYDMIFRPGMVMGFSCFYGSDPDVLSARTGYPSEECAQIIKRCRKSGIWRGATIRTKDWESDYSLFSFVLDMMVAAGTIDRGRDPKVTEAAAARREQRHGEGRCTSCGKPHEDRQRRTCVACRAAVRESLRRSYPIVGAFSPKRSAIEPWYKANDRTRELTKDEP